MIKQTGSPSWWRHRISLSTQTMNIWTFCLLSFTLSNAWNPWCILWEEKLEGSHFLQAEVKDDLSDTCPTLLLRAIQSRHATSAPPRRDLLLTHLYIQQPQVWWILNDPPQGSLESEIYDSGVLTCRTLLGYPPPFCWAAIRSLHIMGTCASLCLRDTERLLPICPR